MDVAALAGFAEAGPFGVPVCVESPDAFAAVFGRPVTLPGGPGRLADAVGAFFAQGGRRAWVVRCGDAATAPARFPLPGVIAVVVGEPGEDDDRLRPAALAARSAGTFADDQRVSVAVRRERIVVEPADAGVRIVAADGAVAAGRLVELPLLRDGVAARRLAVMGEPEADVFPLESVLTVTEAPALDAELAGNVGELVARMARDSAGSARITIAAGPARTAIGRLVRFDPDPVRPPLPARKPRLPEPPTWVLVDDISAPPAGAGPAAVVVSGRAVNVDRDPAGELQAGVGAALELALAGRALAGGAGWRLSGVGCTPQSPGWPGGLPADDVRYAEAQGPAVPPMVPVCGAGLEAVAALVPIMAAASGVEVAPAHRVEAVPAGARSAAARNGIAAKVRDELLRDLAGASVAGLGSIVVGRDRVTPEQPLPGILALLDAPEATLLAVPDAVAGDPPAAPGPAPDPVRLPAIPPDTAAAGFGICSALPETPALADAELLTGGVALSWVVRGANEYEVGLFADAGATEPSRILYRGPAEVTGSGATATGQVAPVLGVTLASGARGWARVRALDAAGRPGGWSIGVPLPLVAGAGEAATQDAAPGDLRAIHGVLLRMAALRGDALALLSVPAGCPAAQAREHAAALQELIGEQERRVLAFGTLAHPWPRVPAPAPEVVRAAPADAVLAGQLAAMAATRGAWIAVSDRPLRDAVDTTGSAGDAAGLRNRYVAGVRGVSADGQDTLALDVDDRPVNVRRLLALVRRAALERGRETVFEPNGPALWRALHRDMDSLLALLHERGAFRPARATEAYRVDVFPGDGRGDDGRCVCELLVAPSLPMRFLTVRLERHPDGLLTAGAG
jgi:hypothetical protein